MGALDDKLPMTTKELAAAIGVTTPLITKWAAEGKLPHKRLGPMLVFDASAVEIARALITRPRRGDIFREADSGAPLDLVELDEAGQQVGKSGRTVRRLVESGDLQGWRRNGRSLVSLIELRALLAQAVDVPDNDRDEGPVGGTTASKTWSAAA